MTESNDLTRRDKFACEIFCAMIASGGKLNIDIEQKLGEQQVRTAYALADTFEHVRAAQSHTDKG